MGRYHWFGHICLIISKQNLSFFPFMIHVIILTFIIPLLVLLSQSLLHHHSSRRIHKSLWPEVIITTKLLFPTIPGRNQSFHHEIPHFNIQTARKAALVFRYWFLRIRHCTQRTPISRFALRFQGVGRRRRGSKHPRRRWVERTPSPVPDEVSTSVALIQFGFGPNSFCGCTRGQPLRLRHFLQ